jgi:hypothetical protein
MDTIADWARKTMLTMADGSVPEVAEQARMVKSVCGDSDPLSWLVAQAKEEPASMGGEETFQAAKFAVTLFSMMPPIGRVILMANIEGSDTIKEAAFFHAISIACYIIGYKAGMNAEAEMARLDKMMGKP